MASTSSNKQTILLALLAYLASYVVAIFQLNLDNDLMDFRGKFDFEVIIIANDLKLALYYTPSVRE